MNVATRTPFDLQSNIAADDKPSHRGRSADADGWDFYGL